MNREQRDLRSILSVVLRPLISGISRLCIHSACQKYAPVFLTESLQGLTPNLSTPQVDTSYPSTLQGTDSGPWPRTARSSHTQACYRSMADTASSHGRTTDTGHTYTSGASRPPQAPQSSADPSPSATVSSGTQQPSPPPSQPPATHWSFSSSFLSNCSTWNCFQQLSAPIMRNQSSTENGHIRERGPLGETPEYPRGVSELLLPFSLNGNYLPVKTLLCSLKVRSESGRGAGNVPRRTETAQCRGRALET